MASQGFSALLSQTSRSRVKARLFNEAVFSGSRLAQSAKCLSADGQCMRFVQIATEGGLMPRPIVRDNIGLWPANRREVIVDFSKYMDGSP
jgi:FtsP/CotA-like multicopper oxidase with cupredoxin domain